MSSTRDIELAASAFQTDERYVEKDWHLVRAVSAIAAINRDGVTPIFSGGTSLSAAWRLIRRFSEDVDFKVGVQASSASAARKLRSAFREDAIDALIASGFVLDGEPLVGNRSQFFRASFHYGPTFPDAVGVRPTLRIEMTFSGTHLPPVPRAVQSLVGQALGRPPEVPAMLCVDPVETAADKLSALAWRTAARDRSSETDDPAIVRHLHDLAALVSLDVINARLQALALSVLDADAGRSGTQLDGRALLEAMLPAIVGDSIWRREYARFVGAVSYGPEAGRIGFDAAVEAVGRLVDRVLGQQESRRG